MKSGIILKSNRGFGFVELFVVIAVIGVLVSLAIPALSGIFGKSESAKAARNAQSLVTTFNAARAAGNSTSFSSASEGLSAITTSPGLSGRGVYTNSVFYVPLGSGELDAAKTKIVPALQGSATEGNLAVAP